MEKRYRIKMLLSDGSWAKFSRSRDEDLHGLSREEAHVRLRELLRGSLLANVKPNFYERFLLRSVDEELAATDSRQLQQEVEYLGSHEPAPSTLLYQGASIKRSVTILDGDRIARARRHAHTDDMMVVTEDDVSLLTVQRRGAEA